MNKSLIKSYVSNLTTDSVIEYGKKEGIDVSISEADIFVSTVKENIDYILDGHALEVIESKKEEISESSYNKLLELYDKYKKFID